MAQSHPYLIQTVHRLELAYFILTNLGKVRIGYELLIFTEGLILTKEEKEISSFLPCS